MVTHQRRPCHVLPAVTYRVSPYSFWLSNNKMTITQFRMIPADIKDAPLQV